MRNVYIIPKETDPAYEKKKQFLLWYMDVWMPAIAGESNFGKQLRGYKMAIERTMIHGKKRILVESSCEAFGWLLLENCYTKWNLIVTKKKENPQFAIPKYKKDDPSTHPYSVCKYSDSRGGQGVGWKPAARPALEGHVELIKKIRAADKENNWKVNRLALKLIREKYNILDKEYVSTRSKKKRKKATTTPREEDFKTMEIESDSEYSVHSDGSSGE